jgi:hypothetical protein
VVEGEKPFLVDVKTQAKEEMKRRRRRRIGKGKKKDGRENLQKRGNRGTLAHCSTREKCATMK